MSGSGQTETYECHKCNSIGFGETKPICCDREMDAVEASPLESPELPLLLRDVFGISRNGIRICIYLMEDGDATASDVAAFLDIDRSTAARRLNHLAEIGIVDKNQQLLKSGGYVNVYTPVPVEQVRKRLKIGLVAWLDEAIDLLEEINQEKVEAVADVGESETEDSTDIYRE